MSSSGCASPLSWLALERHALGELADEEKKRVDDHLAECDACASLLKSIAKDNARPLRPLKKKKEEAKVVSLGAWLARPQIVAIAGLAVAAAIIFVIGRSPKNPDNLDPGSDRIKGSTEVGFTLVREDEAVLPEAGGPYHDGERFKALVTCPPGLRGTFDLVVYEPNAPPSFPLQSTTDLACGNAVPLPGAFKLTGHDPLTVCLVWQDTDRTMLTRANPTSLRHAQCKLLAPTKE
jgi:hypothetical protein